MASIWFAARAPGQGVPRHGEVSLSRGGKGNVLFWTRGKSPASSPPAAKVPPRRPTSRAGRRQQRHGRADNRDSSQDIHAELAHRRSGGRRTVISAHDLLPCGGGIQSG